MKGRLSKFSRGQNRDWNLALTYKSESCAKLLGKSENKDTNILK